MLNRKLALFIAALLILTIASRTVRAEETEVVVVFDEGHGQYYDSRKLSMFLDDLRKFYKVVINRDEIAEEDLSGATILIVANPSRANFTDAEASIIKSFVENGGVLLVMGDWYRYINVYSLNKLVEGAGIEFTKTEVVDPYDFDYREYFPLVGVWADNEIAKAISARVEKKIKYNGCMLNLSDPALPILLSSEFSYTVNEENKKVAKGSVPIAAVSFVGNGVVIAIGGSRVAATKYFYESKAFGNKNFMLALIEWALERVGKAKLLLELKAIVKPQIIEVGAEKEVEVTVIVENKGGELKNIKLELASQFYSDEKVIEKIAEGETLTLTFKFKASSNKLAKIPIEVKVSKDKQYVSSTAYLAFAEEKTLIILDMGHEEHFTPEEMSGFLKLLEDYGPVLAYYDEISEETLRYTKLLILPNPEKPLKASEISAIRAWLKEGGRLIIAGNWYKYFNPQIFDSITEEYGIKWLDGSVWDEANSLPGKPYATMQKEWAAVKEAKALSEGVESVFYSGTSLKVKGEAKPLLLGSPTAKTVDEKKKTLASGEDVVCMALVSVGDGVVFATGSTIMFLDSYYGYDIYNHNERFLSNLIEWLLAGVAKKVLIPVLEITISTPKSLVEGESGTIMLKIKNLGNDTARNVIAELAATEKVGVGKTLIELGNISPGEEKEVSVSIEGLSAGAGEVRVRLSAENHEPIEEAATVEVTSKKAPIDVGLVIAALVVILVTAFIVFRRIKKKA